MTENEGKLTLRPFEERDFRQLADLMARTWLAECPGEPAELASTVELCEYLGQTTWSLVAERDGALLGAALVAEGDAAAGSDRAARWSRRAAEARREAQGRPECRRAVDLEMAVVEEEQGLSDEFVATGAPEAAGTLKLLIVSPDARGAGIGGRLLSAVRERLRSTGAPGYHLLTDDSCDVSFYDHMGLRRVTSRRSRVAWPGSSPDDDFRIHLYAERL